MSSKRNPLLLTKRERQIMDVLYRLGRGTAADIMERLDGAPGRNRGATDTVSRATPQWGEGDEVVERSVVVYTSPT